MATKSLPHNFPSQLRAAVYARVSTNNGQDPTVQTRELEEYCQRRGWKVAGQYIHEKNPFSTMYTYENLGSSRRLLWLSPQRCSSPGDRQDSRSARA